MPLILQLIFVIIRPVFALFLALGAVIGVAASVVIMNLLVGYFAVASEAYTSVHPHVLLRGSWPAPQAQAMADRLARLDPRIAMAAPALHFGRTITLATVNVETDLCDRSVTPEASCEGRGDMSRAQRSYAFDVTSQSQVDVQVRGISVANGDTVANYAKVMPDKVDLERLALSRDSGGNRLPTAFIAQDTLISEVAGNYLLSPTALAQSYDNYWRLHGVIRLGAKSSGAPLLVMGLEQAKALAPAGLGQPNAIELRLKTALDADAVAADLRPGLESGQTVETWIDKERSAFQFLNATWIMVFAVMLSICLVVAISIYSTLTLSILRNRWKVALLGSLGYTPLSVGALFLLFAVGVAAIGIGGGIAIGHYASRWLGGTLYQAFLGLEPARFAATMTWRPAAWMGAATLVIFIVSAIMPARRAVTIRPAEALGGRG